MSMHVRVMVAVAGQPTGSWLARMDHQMDIQEDHSSTSANPAKPG